MVSLNSRDAHAEEIDDQQWQQFKAREHELEIRTSAKDKNGEKGGNQIETDASTA